MRVRSRGGGLVAAAGGWEVAAPGLAWGGEFPELSLSVDAPSLRARTETRDVAWWIRLPGILSYWSAFGPAELTLTGQRLCGLGVVEHAWGTDTRIDVASALPRTWHWDVLAFDDGTWCAALAVDLGLGLFGIGSGNIVDAAVRRVWSYAARVTAWTDAEGRRVPGAWRARMRFLGGTLRYEACAATPVAPAVVQGGFLGFTFEGTWTPRGGSARPVRGTGFCEYRAGSAGP